MDPFERNDQPAKRLPRRPMPEYPKIALPALSAVSGGLLGFAMPALIGADGFGDYLKCGLFAMGGAFVSYGVNRFALERGAPQAAIGSRTSFLTSIGSILLVGGGLFSASYAGLTIAETDQLQLQIYGDRQAAAVAAHVSAARQSQSVLPAIESIVTDLGETATCEEESSCFSGRGRGGQGAYYRAISRSHGRAEAVAAQLREGARRAGETEDRLGTLQEQFQTVVADAGLNGQDRRREAQGVNGEIRQALGALANAVPRDLARAYAAELRGASVAADNPEIARRLKDLLGAHGARLQVVVDTSLPSPPDLPPFPAKAGVADTFDRIGHFLPVAMIVGVIELIFPITLWLYAYVALATPVWRRDAEDAQGSKSAEKADSQKVPVEVTEEPSGEADQSNLEEEIEEPADTPTDNIKERREPTGPRRKKPARRSPRGKGRSR